MLIFEISYHMWQTKQFLLTLCWYSYTISLLVWFFIMIGCLLLCLLFCVELREQNQFSWCLALDEARPRYAIFLNDFLFFANMLQQNVWFFLENVDGNAQCILCYRTLCRNSFFFFCKTTRLVMDFLTTSKGMIGFLN